MISWATFLARFWMGLSGVARTPLPIGYPVNAVVVNAGVDSRSRVMHDPRGGLDRQGEARYPVAVAARPHWWPTGRSSVGGTRRDHADSGTETQAPRGAAAPTSGVSPMTLKSVVPGDRTPLPFERRTRKTCPTTNPPRDWGDQ